MHKTMRFVIPCFAFVLSLWCTDSLAAQYCFKCHQKSAFQNANVHAPVAKNQCSACHNPHASRFKGLIQYEIKDLCYSCHQDKKKSFAQGIVHPPVKEGNCLACHDPHASAQKGLIRKEGLAKSCDACHKDSGKQHKNNHPLFAKGQCSACHQPHQSQNALLLVDEADALCFSCHSKPDMKQRHANYPEEIGSCLSCHSGHGSNRKALVRNVLHKPFEKGCATCHQKGKKTMEACLSCHEPVLKEILSGHNHMSIGGTNSCLQCHSPHAGDTKNLLTSTERQVCRECHQNTFAKYENKKHKHPKTKECSSCHAVHGSSHLAMLKADGNAVCSKCHETQGQFTHPVGNEIIDPRNGQAVTCVSCHYPHGTDHSFNLKLSATREMCIQCHRGF